MKPPSRFGVNAYLAKKVSGFSWGSFAARFLSLDGDTRPEWGRLLQEEWTKIEPLMRDIGSELDSNPAEECEDAQEEDGSSAEDSDLGPTRGADADDPAVVGDPENEDGGVPVKNSHVPKRFYADILSGMGLSEAVVEERYVDQGDRPDHLKVTLEQKKDMAVQKMMSAKTTTDTYIRIANIYLVSARLPSSLASTRCQCAAVAQRFGQGHLAQHWHPENRTTGRLQLLVALQGGSNPYDGHRTEHHRRSARQGQVHSEVKEDGDLSINVQQNHQCTDQLLQAPS